MKKKHERTDPRASNHAKKRVKERCGISKKSADRIAGMALERGVSHERTKGPLKRWLDEKHMYSDEDTRIIVWGDKAYIFSAQNCLITCLQIPAVITKNMKKMIVQTA